MTGIKATVLDTIQSVGERLIELLTGPHQLRDPHAQAAALEAIGLLQELEHFLHYLPSDPESSLEERIAQLEQRNQVLALIRPVIDQLIASGILSLDRIGNRLYDATN